MATVSIKRAFAADLVLLQNISKETFFETFAEVNTVENMTKYLDEGFSLDKLSSELSDVHSEFYFAILYDQIIGYIKLNFGPSQTELLDDHSIEIERIYVLKAFLGKKVGQILYDKAIAIAKFKKMDFVWLGVWEKNSRAIRFYEKNGFVEFDQHIFKLGNDEQIDKMMKLKLQ